MPTASWRRGNKSFALFGITVLVPGRKIFRRYLNHPQGCPAKCRMELDAAASMIVLQKFIKGWVH
ncbi:hypothetical protein LDFHOB_00315 [Candidatus Electronema aureum]